jgi:hypothetical protein
MNFRTGNLSTRHSIEFDSKVRETERAVLLDIDGEEIWFPKSQIDMRDWSNIAEIPEWLAIEKGLI